MTEQEIVKESLIEIFKRSGYAALNGLTQRDFDHISHEIEVSTGTLISGSTIKRLLNGRFSRLPQIATLDAISKYLGYKNWQEYKSAIRHTEELPPEKESILEIDTNKNVSGKLKRFKLMAIGCVAIGIIIIAVFIQFSEPKQFSNFDKATFSARKKYDSRNTQHSGFQL